MALLPPQITLTEPLPVGNAVRLYLAPPPGAKYLRVLRRPTDSFTLADDPGAVTVADHCEDAAVVDALALANGIPVFYRPFAWDGTAWTPGATVTATPVATYTSSAVSPQLLLRDRIELGLAVEVARGTLKPASGSIPVLLAPYMLAGGPMPVVSVHLEEDGPAERFIGDGFSGDQHDPDGGWIDSEGWLARVSLAVVGVSLNPDERVSLREALKRIVIANFPVLSASGLQLIECRWRDAESVQENAQLFMAQGSFSCLAPEYVTDAVRETVDVTIAAVVPPETLFDAYT